MYAGKIVEEGQTCETVYANPRHPYTLGLLRSMPRLDDGPRPQARRRSTGCRPT